MALVPSTTSGSISALNGEVSVLAADADSISIQATGTFTATLSFECSLDGSTWAPLALRQSSQANLAILTTATTSAGVFGIQIWGLPYVRVRASAYTTGTATVTICLTRISK